MSEDTTQPTVHTNRKLLPGSTNTPSHVLSIPVHPHHTRLSRRRVAASDRRIGLHLLGEYGRMILAEYIKTKDL